MWVPKLYPLQISCVTSVLLSLLYKKVHTNNNNFLQPSETDAGLKNVSTYYELSLKNKAQIICENKFEYILVLLQYTKIVLEIGH